MPSDRAQILITAVDQTKGALASVKSNLEGLSNAAGKINGVLASLGAALSVAGLVAAGKAALDTADDLSKLSQKTGVSVESLSLLKPIAEQSGVSMEGLAKGMQKLATSMYDAAGGSKEPLEAFQRLGVAFRDAAGQLRPTEDVLLDLADSFAAMPDGAEKSALAMKLFGKSGVDLIPFLNQGRSGIEALKVKFKELGLEISGDTARAAEQFNDTLDTVRQALSGIAMRVAEAALPALQHLAEALVALASHGDTILSMLRVLGEALVAVLAVKGVAAVGTLIESVGLLKVAFGRLLPVMAVVAAWEMGRGLVQMVQGIRETNAAFDDLARQKVQLDLLETALQELGDTGAVGVRTQMALAAQAAERLKAALPGTAEALRNIQGAAAQVGEALKSAFEEEAKKAGETIKHLGDDYKQLAADIKAIWDGRVAEIETHYKRQEAAAQSASRSEAVAIQSSAQTLLAAEHDKLAAVQAGAKDMESAWQKTYAKAIALAQAAGQDLAAVERQAVEARIGLYGQLESAYRATVDRLIAEEQRHLQAAKAAEEARLALKLSVEDRIRELARKGMDDYAAYQDRLRQIDEKQAQAKAALEAGNYEQARKLAEEAIALAERSASAITRQVEENGKTVTQTVLSEGQAAATAIGQIKESAGIADAALKGLGDAHKQAATAAGQGADEAKRALASVADELGKLRQQLLAQDKLRLDVDLTGAQAGIEKLQALVSAKQMVATIQADTKEALVALDKLKADANNLALVAKVEADTAKVMADLDKLKSTLADSGVTIPALVSFDQPRQQLAAFAQDARTMLGAPTTATHTPQMNLSAYHAALSELSRPSSSVHTVYVRRVETRALGGLIQRFAEGGQAIAEGFRRSFARVSGRIAGPGTDTSDSVPALLSHGEFVVRAASVRKFGEGFFAALNAGFLPHALPNTPRFAAGGVVMNAVAQATAASPAPSRDVVDLRFHLGGRAHTVQSSRDTAMQLASVLRELSRAG